MSAGYGVYAASGKNTWFFANNPIFLPWNNRLYPLALPLFVYIPTAVVLGFLLYWGGIRLNLGAFFKWTSLFILFVAAGLAAGAIRAFHEAGLWNHFQEIAFDMSAVLSTHSLFGTLMEGIFGYQEAPSVSEVAVWFIYLIPALVAFALPPRAGATASRSA